MMENYLWSKEKLTKEERKLQRSFKERLLALPAMEKVLPEREHSVLCEPNSRVFYRDKGNTER